MTQAIQFNKTRIQNKHIEQFYEQDVERVYCTTCATVYGEHGSHALLGGVVEA